MDRIAKALLLSFSLSLFPSLFFSQFFFFVFFSMEMLLLVSNSLTAVSVESCVALCQFLLLLSSFTACPANCPVREILSIHGEVQLLFLFSSCLFSFLSKKKKNCFLCLVRVYSLIPTPKSNQNWAFPTLRGLSLEPARDGALQKPHSLGFSL